MNGLTWLRQGDAVTQIAAALLLLMSVASWVIIFWKAWLMRRAHVDVPRSTSAVWQAPTLAAACEQLQQWDRENLVRPMVDAALAASHHSPATLAGQGNRAQQLTRVLRNALHQSISRLKFGQVTLATVGSTAPFVGLLGTVWGIYHALTGMASAGQLTIERVAGPVGEALIMTAAGLAVAIPAVLAYNVYGRILGSVEADLEGFAHDLRELLAEGATTSAQSSGPMGE
ncbi:MotA/TolQ/ExbB proton channel family protein [Diaphorobacter sp. HDW4A]|uniref:MotA/TolQ/ExbB proton channel family protein n=1 Tax=Diaphorobacter sp. HDW4A TaxID=2714924 RepID=UPI001409EF2D|nr:MotA/TolQ/ExbB proton channel family protein [Diaphorobacter sp. HDW4A]QIL83140.1 MotA/TolQ/ExbB proton channel family protein [Diaphorobacter sp. HDW4A]